MNGRKSVQLDEMDAIVTPISGPEPISNGVLVDVSDVASAAGFMCRVMLTSTVWSVYVEVPKGVVGQDESERLKVILRAAWFAISASPPEVDSIPVVFAGRIAGGEPKHATIEALVRRRGAELRVVVIQLPGEGTLYAIQ